MPTAQQTAQHSGLQPPTPDHVLNQLSNRDVPFITSAAIADQFNCSDETARDRLTRLVDAGELARYDLDGRRTLYFRPDYETATEVVEQFQAEFDLADVDDQEIAAFAGEPYCILPKEENEAYVVCPRFVPFHVGWLDRQTDSYNVFVVNKYVDWIDDVPDDIRSKVGIDPKYDEITVADGEVEVDPTDRDEAWDEFSTERHQDAIPGDAVLEEMDWERLRGLASRLDLLEQGMGRDEVEKALSKKRDDDRIRINPRSEFDAIAKLIEDGNLPFEPTPVDEGLRDPPEGVELRDYQQRAFNRFLDVGMIGVYWPPGAGKTFLSLYTGDRVPGEKLVVVPNNTLKEQWRNRIEELCDHTHEWEVQTYHYLTHGDNIREYEQDGPTLTFFDESHHLPANTFSKLSTIDTDYRIGLSASPYREDDRTEYIFALTGYPVGLDWEELVAIGAVDTPDAKLYLYRTERQKHNDVQNVVDERPGKILILCDSIDRGKDLAADLDVPFVHGETSNRMETFENNRVVIGSRVADEGLSLDELDVVIEYDFHGGSRRQEAQRYGRVMHGDSTGEHIILMTDAEYDDFGQRLMALEEQGINIIPERRE